MAFGIENLQPQALRDAQFYFGSFAILPVIKHQYSITGKKCFYVSQHVFFLGIIRVVWEYLAGVYRCMTSIFEHVFMLLKLRLCLGNWKFGYFSGNVDFHLCVHKI